MIMSKKGTIISHICAIKNTQSIGKAARELGISQPALSASLKKAEDEIGFQIFDRTKLPIKMTEMGQEYLKFLHKCNKMEEDFFCHIADMDESNNGKIVIGGSNSFQGTYLSKLIATYCKMYPHVRLELLEDTIPEIARMLVAGEVDVFVSPAQKIDEDIVYEKLFAEKLLLCVPKRNKGNDILTQYQVPLEHVKAGKLSSHWDSYQCIDLKLFQEEKFILLNSHQHIGAISNQLFQAAKFEPENPIYAEQMSTSYAYTVNEVGISFITDTAIRFGNYKNHATYYICDKDLCSRDMYICYSKKGYLSRACRAFIEMAKKYFI